MAKKKVKKKKDDGIRKNKDLKVLQSHIYDSLGGDCFHIQIMDRKTGKVYAGNIHKTFNSEKQWRSRYDK